jgi:ABC-type transport system involved in multi-copper enzyme maturation permease subunit
MTALAVARDLLLEAAARRWFLALGLALTGLLFLISTSLRLEVVDGALAATRLFGQPLVHSIQSADVALRPVFLVASQVVFWGGICFGVLACADFAPALLSPGRIEYLLSLPVRRWELLAGTFLGVLALALAGAVYASAGLVLVLGGKTGVWTGWPVVSAALAALAFGSVYAGMLAVTVWVRSAALSAATGASLVVLGLLATHRTALLEVMGRGVGRTLFAGVTAVVPPLGRLADAAGALASSAPLAPGGLVRLLAGTLAFAAALLAVAVWRFERRDF